MPGTGPRSIAAGTDLAGSNLAATDLILGMVGSSGVSDVFTGQEIADGVSSILGGATPPFSDATALVKDNADATKLFRFEASGITTGTTRVATIPDRDWTLDTLTIDSTAISGGTSTRVLFESATNKVSESASLTFDSASGQFVSSKVRGSNYVMALGSAPTTGAGIAMHFAAGEGWIAAKSNWATGTYVDLWVRGLTVKVQANGTTTTTFSATQTNFGVSCKFPAAGIKLVDSGGSFSLCFSAAETLTADRTLSIVTGDASRTLTFTGNASISGTNTGDQTSVSGSSGSCTGNAATATALQTARTIAGQSFDGTANISIAAQNLSNGIQGTAGQKVVLLDAVAEKTVSVTISSGVANVGDISGYYGTVIIELDGEGAAADTLDEIQGTFREGQIIYCKAASSARDITYSHNTGTGDDTLYIAGGSVTLATVRGTICFMRRSFGGNNVWVSICVSDP